MEYLFTEFVDEIEIHILPSVEHLSSFGVVKKISRHIPGNVNPGY